MLTILFNQFAVAVPAPAKKGSSVRLFDELIVILRREDEEILTLIPAMWKVIHGAITR